MRMAAVAGLAIQPQRARHAYRELRLLLQIKHSYAVTVGLRKLRGIYGFAPTQGRGDSPRPVPPRAGGRVQETSRRDAARVSAGTGMCHR